MMYIFIPISVINILFSYHIIKTLSLSIEKVRKITFPQKMHTMKIGRKQFRRQNENQRRYLDMQYFKNTPRPAALFCRWRKGPCQRICLWGRAAVCAVWVPRFHRHCPDGLSGSATWNLKWVQQRRCHGWFGSLLPCTAWLIIVQTKSLHTKTARQLTTHIPCPVAGPFIFLFLFAVFCRFLWRSRSHKLIQVGL